MNKTEFLTKLISVLEEHAETESDLQALSDIDNQIVDMKLKLKELENENVQQK